MSTLHDRLAELADRAPTGHPDPGLWDRGRRYGRRRRAGTTGIVVVTVLLLGLVVGASELRSRPHVEPAGPTTEPALPTRIVRPSPWLPGTEDDGPLGQLAAVRVALRGGWTGASGAVVGISATTGEYRFLDLPDVSLGDDVALAPDGRHVAYWTEGESRLAPNEEDGRPTTGMAVYDTATGEVVRHEVPTDHGLDARELTWADPERLVLSYGQWVEGGETSGGSATPGPGLLEWTPTAGGDPVAVRGVGDVLYVEDSTGSGQLLVDDGGERRWVDLRAPGEQRPVPRAGMGADTMAVDVAGTRVAWPRGKRSPNEIAWVRLGGDGARQIVPRSGRTFGVVAWLDDQHLAVSRRIGRGYERVGLFRIDIRTGASTLLVEYPRQEWQVSLATDLLAVPPVDRALPPRPLSPRLTTGLGALVLLAGAASYLFWRRRVRA